LLASRLEERFLVTVHLVDLDRERERDLDLERDEEDLSLTVSEGFTLGPPARLRSFAWTLDIARGASLKKISQLIR
jgi:hypothetical protein